MAIKGANAKIDVLNKIIAALGDDYIGEFDKKYYTWANDGDERVQIAFTLTCPKVYRGIEETGPAVLNFEDDDEAPKKPDTFQPAEITQEEQDTLAAMMKRLGL